MNYLVALDPQNSALMSDTRPAFVPQSRDYGLAGERPASAQGFGGQARSAGDLIFAKAPARQARLRLQGMANAERQSRHTS